MVLVKPFLSLLSSPLLSCPVFPFWRGRACLESPNYRSAVTLRERERENGGAECHFHPSLPSFLTYFQICNGVSLFHRPFNELQCECYSHVRLCKDNACCMHVSWNRDRGKPPPPPPPPLLSLHGYPSESRMELKKGPLIPVACTEALSEPLLCRGAAPPQIPSLPLYSFSAARRFICRPEWRSRSPSDAHWATNWYIRVFVAQKAIGGRPRSGSDRPS